MAAIFFAAAGARAAQETNARGLDRVSDIRPAILACWRRPSGSAGMEFTVIFSVRRSGEILGKPPDHFLKTSWRSGFAEGVCRVGAQGARRLDSAASRPGASVVSHAKLDN
jgi:hypothetical protein